MLYNEEEVEKFGDLGRRGRREVGGAGEIDGREDEG
jgi:hypothetical protein